MMCTNKILRGMAMAFLLMLSQSAFAVVVLDFSPNTQTVLLPGQASVDIMATGLNNEYIGGFDFIVDWDTSILSLASVSFGSSLGFFPFQAEITDNALGTSNLAELSFEDVTLFQTGITDFILATLVFDTLSVGLSALNLTENILGGGFLSDETGFGALAATANTGYINVISTAVPEPGTLLLMGIGLLTVLSVRRQNNV